MPALILNGTCGGCKACLKITVSPQLTTEYVHLTVFHIMCIYIYTHTHTDPPTHPRTHARLFLSSAWLGAVSFSLSLSAKFHYTIWTVRAT